MTKVMRIHPKDNVLIALKKLVCGEKVWFGDLEIVVHNEILQGHKIALQNLKKDEDVIKYGFPIGTAQTDIEPGQWVHTHNLKTKLEGMQEYNYHPIEINQSMEYKNFPQTFQGYLRKNGQVGIRNEIWIIPTVSCTNQIATLIAREAQTRLKSKKWAEKLDGIYEFKHPYGCSQLGDDHLTTQKLLASLANHPNAAGVLVLGLGCENNNINEFKKILIDYDTDRVKFLIAQEVEDEVLAGADLIMELAERVSLDERQELPLNHLKVGLKCGDSDGFSGITANPLVGKVSDMIIASGGSSVLTEVPEMFGAEQILMNRAENREVFEKIVDLINNFKDYFISHDQPIYEIPSPSNKAGGISTLEDKSLGCTQKGGISKIVDVLNYGERLKKSGLNLLYSPANDLVASTALAASGCQIVLFTTGRGTPLGTCVPTMKIATNTRLFEYKSNWMDYNAGQLVEGIEIGEVAVDLLEEIVQIASGEKQTQNERMGFREIAILKTGVTL